MNGPNEHPVMQRRLTSFNTISFTPISHKLIECPEWRTRDHPGSQEVARVEACRLGDLIGQCIAPLDHLVESRNLGLELGVGVLELGDFGSQTSNRFETTEEPLGVLNATRDQLGGLDGAGRKTPNPVERGRGKDGNRDEKEGNDVGTTHGLKLRG